MEPEEIGEGYASSLEQLPGDEEDLTPGLPVNLKLREMTEEQAAAVEARPHVRTVSLDTVDGIPPEPEISAASSRVSAEEARRFHNVHVAHERGFKGKGARVAVLDTGLDASHAQRLGGRLVAKESTVPGEDWRDTESGHGTWCVGCIAEIAPEAELVVIKVLSTKNGSGSGSGIIKGINRAIELGATHISMSLGGNGNPDDPMSRATDAADQKGVLCPCAAGNEQRGRSDYTADKHHPGNARRAICVAAVDSDSRIADFSSWGVCVDIAAVGVLTEGWGLNGSFGRAMSGSSMATPAVSGVLALGHSALS